MSSTMSRMTLQKCRPTFSSTVVARRLSTTHHRYDDLLLRLVAVRYVNQQRPQSSLQQRRTLSTAPMRHDEYDQYDYVQYNEGCVVNGINGENRTRLNGYYHVKDGHASLSQQQQKEHDETTQRRRTATTLHDYQQNFHQQVVATGGGGGGGGSDTTNTAGRPIYVAATKEHVGKTSTSLALMSGLQKRFKDKVGFMKPVGQKCLQVYEEDLSKTIDVDKDVALFKQHFECLQHLPYRYMSPVLIPPGYTKKYIDGKIPPLSIQDTIQTAYKEIRNLTGGNGVVLCEGTGHCAVGSIVGAGNANVASWINADMVLVANGGLGSTFDELELNRILAQHYNVNIAGIIVNKISPHKYDQTKHYLSKAFMDQWNIPLLGCIPDRPYLGCPALIDIQRLFNTQLMSGSSPSNLLRHYTVKEMTMISTSLDVFYDLLKTKPKRTLYICHSSRADIVSGFINEYQDQLKSGNTFEAALIICGKPEKYPLPQELLDRIALPAENPPILRSPYSTLETMERIHNFTPKLNSNDKERVSKTAAHYEPFINFDLLLKRTGNTSSVIQKEEEDTTTSVSQTQQQQEATI